MLSALLAASVAAAFTACGEGNTPGSDEPSSTAGGGDSANAAGGTSVAAVSDAGSASCDVPNLGCACETEGQTVDCGHVQHRQGNYVSCSAGTRTCSGGVWSDCLGEKYGTAFYSPVSGAGVGEQGLATDAGSCAGDPCDPYCMAWNDTAPGFDAGVDSGVTVTDAGVSLPGVVGNTMSACTGLTSTPPATTLTVTSIPASGAITYTTSPVPAQFTAQFTPANCFSGNAPALWTVDNTTISTVSTSGLFNLVDPVPGPVHVIAYAGMWNTSAAPSTVNVVVNAVDTTIAPSGVTKASFSAGTLADNIQVLYPYNATVLPLGQIAPIIQWDNKGVAATSVMVQLRYPAGTGALFTWSGVMPESQANPTPLLAAQPRAFIPQNVWTAFEDASKGGDADIVIQRIVLGAVRTPNVPVTLHFATDQLKGTVYYQSYGTNLATNYSGALATGGGTHSFGAATLAIKPGATAPVLVAGDNSNCRVCHSVAANGSVLVTESGSNYSDSLLFKLSNLAVTDMGGSGTLAWPALSPDGTYLFANSGSLSGASNSASQMYSVPSGASISTTGLPSIAALTPSFSPDGNHVAYDFNGGSCKGPNIACSTGTDCCSDSCGPEKGAASACASGADCASGACNACAAASSACSVATDCCSDNCACGAAAVTCAANADCCSNTCTAYKAAGATCALATDCASGNCGSCGADAATCSSNSGCCSNNCAVCLGANATATIAAECCSGVWNSSTKKCTGTGTAKSVCLGTGTANKTCVGGVATSTCSGTGTSNKKCVGGVAGNQCVGGAAGNYCQGGTSPDSKSLASIDYSVLTKTFSNPQTLATPGLNLASSGGQTVGAGKIYYPYYLPNSADIVWHLETVYNGRDLAGTRSQCDNTGTCNNEGTHAEIWWTDVASKRSARLDQLNGLGYLPRHPSYASETALATAASTADPGFNYEPTVNPQVTGGYSWVVFTTRRLYGNIATINPFWSDPRFQTIDRQPTTKKLWVAAVDVNGTPGTDPSHPAFYLQGQELLAGNSRGYWVLNACEPAGPPTPVNLCTSTLDCCPATGSNPPVTCALDAPPMITKHCTSASTSSCAPTGAACTADSQCCGFPTSACAQGVCAPPPPALSYYGAQFTRDYDGLSCPQGTHVVWQDVGMEGLIPQNPSGAAIQVYGQVASSFGTWVPSSPILLGTMSGPPMDQSAAFTNYDLYTPLAALGSSYPGMTYLHLTFVLTPTSDHSSAPTLVDWRARFDCVPME